MPASHVTPPLPRGRGPLSSAVSGALLGRSALPDSAMADLADPFGEDLQLALYTCYELHYRGFGGVDPAWEWDTSLLSVRASLEDRFLTALRRDAAARQPLAGLLAELVTEPADPGGVPRFLAERGTLDDLRAYARQRSLYHLKEADPHAWVLPRLTGRAKAAMAAVEFDEFGGGRADRVHARLFADLMTDLGLDSRYGHYLDCGYPEMLALVNAMSLFGLHRRMRGALVGHFAAVEITSSPASRHLARAMARTGAGPAAEHFYDEHVEADAVHEQIVRNEVIDGLLDEEPRLEPDIAFGIAATSFLEDRLGRRFLTDRGA
ncbi:iron-containing redox enzyme family protein [Streptomyces sp. NPDC088190]|uniref:iron-containing redox enzyme family protein n=1 Tax=unclassified Streptomyces TaxID=2593676 RepID=UPI002E7872D0|nr:iron-containing redox enzyme family protein [Streptomyces sp. JV190]MEE1842413.1 iron-containing redox enzyme family protein [Streptomyces sp. JV190]